MPVITMALPTEILDLRRKEENIRNNLAICESLHGVHHPSSLRTLLRLSENLLNQCRLRQAENTARKCLARSRAHYGDDNPNTAGAMLLLGLVFSRQSNFEDARKMFAKSLRIFRQTQGPTGPNYVMGIMELVTLGINEGQYADAERTLLLVLRIHHENGGLQNISELASFNLARVYLGLNRNLERVEVLLHHCKSIPEAALNILATLRSMGLVFHRP
jgi:tetratricopeptide (TPR) repeat protein